MPTKEPPTRRSADRVVPLDVATLAVRIGEVEGVQQLQSQALRASIDTMSSALQSLQGETRAINNTMHDMALQQASNSRDRDAIERLERGLADMGARHERNNVELTARLESFFDDAQARDGEWRAKHEEANKASSAALWEQVHRLDRTNVLQRGVIIGGGALITVIVSGFLWTLNQRFEIANTAILNTVETAQYNRELIDTEREARHHIELYLASGQAEPFRPQEQK